MEHGEGRLGRWLDRVGFATTQLFRFGAFRWTQDEGMVGLGYLPGRASSRAYGVSGNGSVVVGDSYAGGPGPEAFRWTAEEGIVCLGDLPRGTFQSKAYDVSADGSVVVGVGAVEHDTTVASIWDAQHGMRRLQDVLTDEYGLDLTGWHLSGAVDISGDGLTIVGSGRHPNGDAEAWIAHIPEPATISLLALCAGAALRRRS